MSRRRVLVFGVLAYLFTLGLFLPIYEYEFGSPSFAEFLMFKALASIPLTIGGLFVGLAALEGAKSLLVLMGEIRYSKDETGTDLILGAALVVGLLLYGLWIAWVHFPHASG